MVVAFGRSTPSGFGAALIGHDVCRTTGAGWRPRRRSNVYRLSQVRVKLTFSETRHLFPQGQQAGRRRNRREQTDPDYLLRLLRVGDERDDE